MHFYFPVHMIPRGEPIIGKTSAKPINRLVFSQCFYAPFAESRKIRMLSQGKDSCSQCKRLP